MAELDRLGDVKYDIWIDLRYPLLPEMSSIKMQKIVCSSDTRSDRYMGVIFKLSKYRDVWNLMKMFFLNKQGRQSGLKSGGAEQDFPRLQDLEVRNLGYCIPVNGASL